MLICANYHLTQFAVLVALPDKKEQTIAKALVKRVCGIFGPPETLHSDQGPDFENKVVKQLQDVFGYKKTKTTLLMLSDTGVDMGGIVLIIISIIVYGPKEDDLEYRAHQVPQCQELIAAYRAQHQLETITPPPCNKRKHPASKDGNPPGSDTAPKDGSPLESEPAIRKRPCNKRKRPASKDGNPLGSDTAPEDGSPLESEPAIRKRPCNKRKHRASKDSNPLESDTAPKDGSPLEREPTIRKRKSRSGSNKEENNPKRRT